MTGPVVSKKPWAVVAVVFAAIILIIVVVTVVSSGGTDTGENSAIDRDTLDVEFLSNAFALAEAKNGTGNDPVSVRLSTHDLRVKYFDPNAQEIIDFEVDTYSDGYQVRVEDNPYEEYRPQRFPLVTITPQDLIDAADSALAKASNATYFTVTAEVDPDTGDVLISATASGDEFVEVTTGPFPIPAATPAAPAVE